jgi:hypothetical protein
MKWESFTVWFSNLEIMQHLFSSLPFVNTKIRILSKTLKQSAKLSSQTDLLADI